MAKQAARVTAISTPETDAQNRTKRSDFGVPPVLSRDDYALTTGERLIDTLDLERWETGSQLTAAMQRIEREIAEASLTERAIVKAIREKVFSQLHQRPSAPPCAGVFQATPAQIADTQKTVLFNGLTEACDGTNVPYETLPIQIVQIAVALTSYSGSESTWSQRIFRRDMRMRAKETIADDLIDILNDRAGGQSGGRHGYITSMLRRAVMTTAERAVLAKKATAPWRMGHGNPLAHEILTGSGMTDIIRFGLPIIEKLVVEHKRFLFVTSDTAKKHYLTIGNALRPGEYAIIDDAHRDLQRVFGGHYTGEWARMKPMLRDFERSVGPLVVAGVYRASSLGPAHLFYAHRDHVHEAALIALADSVLQEHRSFPMLIDLADGLCKAYFGAETLTKPVVAAFAEQDDAYRYLPERRTRQ